MFFFSHSRLSYFVERSSFYCDSRSIFSGRLSLSRGIIIAAEISHAAVDLKLVRARPFLLAPSPAPKFQPLALFPWEKRDVINFAAARPTLRKRMTLGPLQP